MDEDEDEEMAELRAQEARRVRDEAKKCPSSNGLRQMG